MIFTPQLCNAPSNKFPEPAPQNKTWKAPTQGPRRGCQRPEELCRQGLQGNGSLLVAREAGDAAALQVRAEALAARGVAAEALTARQVRAMEPHLALPAAGAALLVPGDAQLVGCRSQMHRRSAMCLHPHTLRLHWRALAQTFVDLLISSEACSVPNFDLFPASDPPEP